MMWGMHVMRALLKSQSLDTRTQQLGHNLIRNIYTTIGINKGLLYAIKIILQSLLNVTKLKYI